MEITLPTNNANHLRDKMASEEITPHTPGPWSVCGGGKCSCKTITAPDGPIAIATHGAWGDDYPAIRLVGDSSLNMKAEAYMEQITYGEVPEPVARANALLIAAAPTLLQMLRVALADMELCGRGETTTAKQIRAAIACATEKVE